MKKRKRKKIKIKNIFLMESSMMNKQFKKFFFIHFFSRVEARSLYIDFEGMKHNEIRKESRNEKFLFLFNAKPLIIKKETERHVDLNLNKIIVFLRHLLFLIRYFFRFFVSISN
jgi:hypothetical protein